MREAFAITTTPFVLAVPLLLLLAPLPAAADAAAPRGLLDGLAAAPDALALATALAVLAREYPAAGETYLVFPGAGEALPQGDADGDGRDDVLLRIATATRAGSATTLQMVSSGAGVLWSWSSVAQLVEATPAVDLDGDGRTDVLVLEATLGREARSWSVSALRGVDGGVLWVRALQGEDAQVGAVTLQTAAFLLALVGGDADGDGGADVWLQALDVAVATAPGAAVGAGALRLDVVSGGAGESLWSAAWPLGPGGAGIALPAGDMDGDARADTIVTLVPTRALAAGASTAAAFGAQGAPLWARAYPGVAFAQPVPDLDGDGAADALVSLGGAADALEALSGASGLSRWTHPLPLFLVVVPGSIDGGAGADVLLMEGETAPGETRVRALALDGTSGSLVYDTRPYAVPLPANGWNSIEYQTLAGDFDGDGVLDTLLNVQSGLGEDVHIERALTLRGAKGLVQWESDWSAPGVPIGDVTGDGADDVALRGIYDGGAAVWLVDGATGASPWLVSFSNGESVRALGPGDVGGDARADLLLVLHEGTAAPKGEGGDVSTRLLGVDADAVVVWGG